MTYSETPVRYPAPVFNSPVYIQDLLEIPNSANLRWVFQRSLAADSHDWHKVIIDGVEYGDVNEAKSVISGLRPGNEHVIEVLPISGVNRQRWPAWNFHAVPSLGGRLKVSVPKADLSTYPDFQSYLLYWDEGAGTPANTLLKEMVGAENNEFITSELTDGTTYLFRMKMKDVVGNEGAFGSEFPGTVETFPEATESDAIAYSAVTFKATLTADKPAGQESDTVGYALYSSYLPGFGLQPDLILDSDHRLEWFETSDTLSHVTEELAPGDWRFAYRAVDSNGFESPYTTLRVNVDTDHSEIGNVPDAPYTLTAEPVADGKVLLTARMFNTTDSTHVHFYTDGAFTDEVATVSGTLEYAFTTGALTNGQEYSFKCSVANGAVESGFSDDVTATADDTAPANSTTLTITRVNQ